MINLFIVYFQMLLCNNTFDIEWYYEYPEKGTIAIYHRGELWLEGKTCVIGNRQDVIERVNWAVQCV